MRSMTEKVLVVEDDNSIATLTRLQLESKGYVVTVAHNGTEGLRLAYAWQPDLVILDIMMPDMDGWTVCQRLREMSDVPIVFVTAVGQERNIVRGLQLGADDYIVKPFSTKELLARIEAVLRRRGREPTELPQHYTNRWLSVDMETRQVKVDRHYLKLYIWYLRQKLEKDPNHPLLFLTERGVGYRLARAGEPEV